MMYLFIKAYKQSMVIISGINNASYMPNALNEYHNAFSHMAPIFYRNDEHEDNNLKKAGSHLVRGILDSCKYVIEFNKNKILNNSKLLEGYREIRKKELAKIGIVDIFSTNKPKSLILEYMRFAKNIHSTAVK